MCIKNFLFRTSALLRNYEMLRAKRFTVSSSELLKLKAARSVEVNFKIFFVTARCGSSFDFILSCNGIRFRLDLGRKNWQRIFVF